MLPCGIDRSPREAEKYRTGIHFLLGVRNLEMLTAVEIMGSYTIPPQTRQSCPYLLELGVLDLQAHGRDKGANKKYCAHDP